MLRFVLLVHLLLLLAVHVKCYKPDAAAANDQPDNTDDKYTLQDIMQMLSRSPPDNTVRYHNVGAQPPYSWLKMMGSSSGAPMRNKRSLASGESLQQSVASASTATGAQLTLPSEEELRTALADAVNDMDSNDLQLSDDVLNAPLSQLDLHLIQYSPLMKLIRILYYIQVKRQLTYNPRLGRRSAAGAGGGEECNEFQQRSPYSAVRCLGKKDMQYTPRLGRRSG